MRKILWGVCVFLILFSGISYAADSMTVNVYKSGSVNFMTVKVDFVDTPSLTLESALTGIDATLRGWHCYLAEFVPGTGGALPTDQFDIDITNTAGTDIFGAALHDLSNSANATILPTINTSYKGPFPIKYDNADALTFTVTNNGVAGAGTVYLYFTRY